MPPSLPKPTPLIHPIRRVYPNNIGLSVSDGDLLQSPQLAPNHPSTTTEHPVRPRSNNDLKRVCLGATYATSLFQLPISSSRWDSLRGMRCATDSYCQALPHHLLLKTVTFVARSNVFLLSVAMNCVVKKVADSNFHWLPF